MNRRLRELKYKLLKIWGTIRHAPINRIKRAAFNYALDPAAPGWIGDPANWIGDVIIDAYKQYVWERWLNTDSQGQLFNDNPIGPKDRPYVFENEIDLLPDAEMRKVGHDILQMRRLRARSEQLLAEKWVFDIEALKTLTGTLWETPEDEAEYNRLELEIEELYDSILIDIITHRRMLEAW